MWHIGNSTFSILLTVVLFNGTLLATLALYLWHHRGYKVLR